jgi:hypothetical protein
MANIENTSRKLVLKEGSTTLALDRDSGKATLRHKSLLWSKKPIEFAISVLDDIAVKSNRDDLSGATMRDTVLENEKKASFGTCG